MIDDTIVHFLCALETKIFEKQLTLYKFVSPALTQLLQRSSTENCKEIIKSASLEKYDILFFPLSNLKGDLMGHWSLLIWCRTMKNKFLHFDSLKNMNLVPAKKFSDKIAEAFNIKNYKFKNMKSPLQNNDKDCGVYLMAIMDEIASTRKISDNLRNKITPDYIKKFRIALMTCITQSKANYNWETYYKMLVE